MGGATSVMCLSSGTRSDSKRLIPLCGLIPSTGRERCDWLQVASSRIMLYANEGCKTCASVAGLVASFIAVVMWV